MKTMVHGLRYDGSMVTQAEVSMGYDRYILGVFSLEGDRAEEAGLMRHARGQ